MYKILRSWEKYKHIIPVINCLLSAYCITSNANLDGIKELVSNAQNLWGQGILTEQSVGGMSLFHEV